jgi:AN1-type zinc finger protein 5/6
MENKICNEKKDINKKLKKKKCFNCNKKLTMLNFECKCNHKFCTICILPEIHNCQFNYIEEQKAKLEKSLPKIINKKIEII